MFCGLPAVQARSSTLALALTSVVVFGFTTWSSNILIGFTAQAWHPI
jgi:hypothetical protein